MISYNRNTRYPKGEGEVRLMEGWQEWREGSIEGRRRRRERQQLNEKRKGERKRGREERVHSQTP